MERTAGIALVLALGCCGGDSGTPPADSNSPGSEGGGSGVSCSQVGACSDTCASACPSGLQKLTCMIQCSDDCKTTGCASAQQVYGELYKCINARCTISCTGGPTPQCKECVTKQCGAEEQACNANRC